MEGLIKDLVGVALDSFNNDEDLNPDARDERARSTWAEVVSGDRENDEEKSDRRHGYNGNQWLRKDQNRPEQEEWGAEGSRFASASHKEQYRPEQEWQWESSRFSNRPPKEKWEAESERISNRPQKSDGDNDDGWETVSKKPPRRQHKVPKDHWNDYKLPSSQQQYCNDLEIDTGAEPSEDELADLSQACNKLWDLDLNRLVPGKDYEIDIGEGKKVYQNEDMAEGSFFSWVSDDVFRKPTFSRFCSLLDNYNPHQGSKEVVTSEEKQEQGAFIEEISRTAPIKFLHKYLTTKGIASGSFQDFKRMMTSLWFDLYSRGGTLGSSSAFEHVFVGEIKQCGEVSGFHNWLQFYLEEAKGRVDYQGYIFPRHRGEIPDSETQLLTIQFEWNGVLKSVSSTLVGVSPEFEMALYTLCFFVGGEDNYVQLGPYSVNIKCYRQGDQIGSVFPIAD